MASQTNELAIGSGISNASTAADSVSEKEKTQLDEPLSLPAPTNPVVPATENSRANDGENVTNHVYPKGLVLFLLMSSVFISMFLVALVCVFVSLHPPTRSCMSYSAPQADKIRTTPFA